VSRYRPAASVAVLAVVATAYLRWQGRVWWCACGSWNPVSLQVNSAHNSQHLLDPYSLSHVLHGILFFGALWPARRWIGPGWRAAAATAIEIGWEMLENSPVVIDRYRTTTIALGYTGDSVLNSAGDVVSFVLGFWLAGRLGWWRAGAVFVAVELLLLWTIRDNLTLNVLMLLWPVDAVRRWQAGA